MNAYNTQEPWKNFYTALDEGSLPDGTKVLSGRVASPHGFVQACFYYDLNDTIFWFLHGGKLYKRFIWDRHYTRRGIITLARRFAREIVEAAND